MNELAFLYATFPRPTETFVRRELRELKSNGFTPKIFSIWKGAAHWEGEPIYTFSPLKVIYLLIWIPYWAWQKPKAFKIVLSHLCSSSCPNLQNWTETFWGLAFALANAHKFQRSNYQRIHAVWATMPATSALGINLLINVPFSMGAHAYDVFRNQGDWLLSLKLNHALIVRTSSQSTAKRLSKLGLTKSKLVLIHRSVKPTENFRQSGLINPRKLKLLCVGRLVEKKGYFLLIEMLELLKKKNIPFLLTIIGDGPLRCDINLEINRRSLGSEVALLGHLSESKVQEHYRYHDALLFSGIIASNGDRDGIPNVISEAMVNGLLILASNRAGSSEAFIDEESGFSLDPYKPYPWVERLKDFYNNPLNYSQIRENAIHHAKRKFSAKVNCQLLRSLFDG